MRQYQNKVHALVGTYSFICPLVMAGVQNLFGGQIQEYVPTKYNVASTVQLF